MIKLTDVYLKKVMLGSLKDYALGMIRDGTVGVDCISLLNKKLRAEFAGRRKTVTHVKTVIKDANHITLTAVFSGGKSGSIDIQLP